MNELYNEYKDQGLVIIGVCASKGAEKMEQTVKTLGISYPVCADIDEASQRAYKVNGFPDYQLIDRSGRLRIADCKNGRIDEAIRMLLAEKE